MKLHRKAALASSFDICAAAFTACDGSDNHSTPSPATTGPFKATILVSGGSVTAPNVDANLKNGWGIAFNPTGVMWVSDTIDAFDPNTGAFIGAMTQTDGSTFKKPGIWGISFGNNFANQPLNTLFFAAGPTPTTGVYGRIDVAQ